MKLKNIKSPRDIAFTINKVFYAILMKSKTEYIMNRDWDNLIILDACRYDMFVQENTIPGKLEYIYSKGSSTGHFLLENFKNRSYLDTVYISSNPLVNYNVPDSFYKIISVWDKGWNEKYKTILPDTMVEFALKAQKTFIDKRLIIHFMQPHFPFIDDSVRKRIGEHEGVLSRNMFLGGEKIKHIQTVWKKFQAGQLDRATVWEAYVSNLKIALNHVQNLLSRLEGKSVITSDHGNLFGERLGPFPLKKFGHPGGLYKKNLIKVPWLVVDDKGRRKIKAGEKRLESDSTDTESQEYTKKLSALGYL